MSTTRAEIEAMLTVQGLTTDLAPMVETLAYRAQLSPAAAVEAIASVMKVRDDLA